MSRANPFRFLIEPTVSDVPFTEAPETQPDTELSENYKGQNFEYKPVLEGFLDPSYGEKEGGQGDTTRLSFFDKNTSQKPKFSVRTQDGQNFRIWLCSQYEFTPAYINQLCRFLDTREQTQTVRIYLGANLSEMQCTVIGSVIGAIDACRAEVTVIANAFCGIAETMIFCFAPHREMRRYATLQIGGYSLTEARKDQTYFLEAFFQRAVDIGYLTEAERKDLIQWGNTKTIYPENARSITSTI